MREGVILAPPATEEQKLAAETALYTLLPRFDNNKNKMARELGFARNTVSFWFSKGYLGRNAAKKISTDLKIPLRDLRPDLFMET